MKPLLNRAIVGYVLAGFALLFAFLYLRFPGRDLKDGLATAAAARYPGTAWSIKAVRPSFPPGIALSDITAAFGDRPERVLHADGLTVRPAWLSLLRGRFGFVMEGEGYGGAGTGRVDFSRPLSIRGPLSAAMNIRNVRVEKCPWLRDILASQVTGTLNVAADFDGTREALKGGAGNIEFTLTNGVFPLQGGLLGFERIDFSRIEGKMAYKNGALKVNQLTLNGNKLRCSLKGNILLADDFRESRIDLSGTANIAMQGSRQMTLTITGTIGNPVARLM